jgi:Na+:H+ antiporter, NhaA family
VLLPAQRFFYTESTSGIVLLGAAATALIWVNSPVGSSYEQFWRTHFTVRVGGVLLSHSLREWINDALMVLFFFVVGLEVKREFVCGALSNRRNATLPVIAALGGMVVPAALYAAFNASQPTTHGWGIPMATDIAFALGVLALVGDRISSAARIFLLTLATADDIGAMLVIAVFYSSNISPGALVGSLAIIAVIIAMRQVGIRSIHYYVPVGLVLWLTVLQSGVHATLAGVVLGLLTPTKANFRRDTFAEEAEQLIAGLKTALRNSDDNSADLVLGQVQELAQGTESPADRLLRILHPWSSFLVLPLFALANAGVPLTAAMAGQAFSSPVSRGVAIGLLFGKVVGIVVFSWLAVRIKVAQQIAGLNWIQFGGIGVLAGIGFTVSLFITDLAFQDAAPVAEAKAAILFASALAGLVGYFILRFAPSVSRSPSVKEQLV